MNKSIIILIFCCILVFAEEKNYTEIETIVIQFAQPLSEWVGFNRSALEVARQCKLDQLQSELLNFHIQLAGMGQDFSRQHIDLIRKTFKQKSHIKHFFMCVTEKRNTQNQYFKEQKKYKYLAQFIKQHPSYASETFYAEDKPFDKGHRLGRFFRAFFQYYYQFVLHPAETVSTKLIRAMTPKTDLFDHEDISQCLSLDTIVKLTQSLQNLGIHNIYLNIPQAFNALKYMKFKQKCKGQKYDKLLKKIHSTLQNIDMFKVMYHEYNPWVQIAAQKYGSKQIEQIATIFSRIANNKEQYEKLSLQQL